MPHSHPSDSLATDQCSFQAAYQTYAPLVYGLTQKFISDESEASAILMRVFTERFSQNEQASELSSGTVIRLTLQQIFEHLRHKMPIDLLQKQIAGVLLPQAMSMS